MIVQNLLFLHKDCRLFPNVDANGLACQFIRFFVDWYKKISGCRHHVRTMSGDFLDIRTKSRSFCTNIRVNFLMFTSTFQLFSP